MSNNHRFKPKKPDPTPAEIAEWEANWKAHKPTAAQVKAAADLGHKLSKRNSAQIVSAIHKPRTQWTKPAFKISARTKKRLTGGKQLDR